MKKVAVIGIVGRSVFLSVDAFHTGGETVPAHGVREEYGGKGFNAAVAAARAGASVSFLSAVGEKECADIAAFLEKEGIDAHLCPKKEATAFAAILTDREGANRVTVYEGARLTVPDADAFSKAILNADILLLNNETPEEVNLAAAQAAGTAGVPVILNPAPVRPLSPELRERISLFTPNEFECAGLEAYRNVIETRGSRGCYLRESGKSIPATRGKAVDTTGAGDTFNGVLAAMLAEGADLETAAQAAVRASGISVTRPGAVSSIPYRIEWKGEEEHG